MKVLIIDDSRLARKELRYLLQAFPEVEIAGEAADAMEAVEKIEQFQPDLLLLDIQMPGQDGFELLESLEQVPQVVFTTAYNEYALQAFEYNALDYLQKPISEERLARALEKVKEKLIQKTKEENKFLLSEEHQVFVKDGEQCWFVQLRDIRLFEVNGSYTRVFFEDHRPMIPKTLNYLEQRLDEQVFFRANRQQIVNLRWIKRIEPWFSGTIKLYLQGGEEIEVSRRQSIRFKELMSF